MERKVAEMQRRRGDYDRSDMLGFISTRKGGQGDSGELPPN
jgi:hypothetical protein